MCIQTVELNSREFAVLFWTAAFLLYVLLTPKVRGPAWGVVKAFFQWKLQATLAAAAGWSTACVWLLARLGIWQCDNLKTTLVWGLTFMFVTLFGTFTKEGGVKTLRKLAREAVTATAVVVFIAQFYTLPFWAELLLLPILSFIAMMAVYAAYKKEHARLVGPLNSILSLAGMGLLCFSALQIIRHLDGFLTMGTAREFAVPILLSLMYLPFLYLMLVVVAYENAAIRLHFRIEDRSLRRWAFFRGLLAFGANIEMVERYFRALIATDTFDRKRIGEAIREVRRIRQRERERPSVDPAKGWSPYDAQEYLKDVELLAGDYHRTVVDWSAESPPLKIGDSFLTDRITYRISGTEAAATKLSLELNGNLPGSPERSDLSFWGIADLLIRQALGDESAQRFTMERHAKNEGQMQTGRFQVTWRRDEWGKRTHGGFSRKITLIHPAHQDPFLIE